MSIVAPLGGVLMFRSARVRHGRVMPSSVFLGEDDGHPAASAYPPTVEECYGL